MIILKKQFRKNDVFIYLFYSMDIILIQTQTFSWSPLNRSRKLACVPVVPLAPRNRSSLRNRWMFCRSKTRSDIQRHARFPTVVNCAGLSEKYEKYWMINVKVIFRNFTLISKKLMIILSVKFNHFKKTFLNLNVYKSNHTSMNQSINAERVFSKFFFYKTSL